MAQPKTDICRLCSTKENLIYMFDRQQRKRMEVLRYFIWLATGIEIKENDVIPKTVCHRCCEIAGKLYKYRTNAVANDKLLKEQIRLSDTAPITNQNELRVQSNIVDEKNNFPNPLDHFRFSLKKKAFNDNKSTKRKFRAKAIPKHPSIQILFKTYNNIVLPIEIFTSNVSPVISLNSSEVNDWYSERLTKLNSKLKGITFQNVPRIGNKISPVNGSSKSKEEIALKVPAPSSYRSNEVSPKQTVFREVPSSSRHPPSLFQRISSLPRPGSWSRSTSSPHLAPSPRLAPSLRPTPSTVLERRVFREAPSWSHPTTSSSYPALSSYRSGFSPRLAPSSRPTPTTAPEHERFLEVAPLSRTVPSSHPISSPPRTLATVPKFGVFKETPSPVPCSAHLSPSPRTTSFLKNGAFETTPSSSRISPAPEKMPLEEIPLPENNAENSESTKRTRKRPYSKIVYSREDDFTDGDIGKEDFNCNYVSGDDFTRKNPSVDHKVATSSNPIKAHKQPSTKKRTAPRGPYTKRRKVSSKRKSTSKRKKNNPSSPSDQVVERKGNNAILNTDLSKEGLSVPSGQLEATNVSDFELPNTELLLPDLTGKTHEIFMCSICNKLHDSKQELANHEKTHLTCKFCKKKLRNVVLLMEHQNESCFINIVKNKPIVKLHKIDTVPSVVEKYPEAFKQPEEETAHPDIQEVVLPMPPREETLNQSKQAVYILISDDEDIECIEISRHKIVNNPFSASPSSTKKSQTVNLLLENASQPNPTLSPRPTVPKEEDMIRSLFKKYFYPSEKCDKETQTFSASDYNIKYTNTNLITLDNMFSELASYTVPISLESQSKMSARFIVNAKDPQLAEGLECWALKKTVEIQKRALVVANQPSTPKSDAIALNLLDHSKLVSSPDSVILKKPLPPVLREPIPNIPKTIIPVTLTKLNPKSTTTEPTFTQFSKPASTIQYQTPVPPPSTASLRFGMNKDQPSQSSQQNVLHIINKNN